MTTLILIGIFNLLIIGYLVKVKPLNKTNYWVIYKNIIYYKIIAIINEFGSVILISLLFTIIALSYGTDSSEG